MYLLLFFLWPAGNFIYVAKLQLCFSLIRFLTCSRSAYPYCTPTPLSQLLGAGGRGEVIGVGRFLKKVLLGLVRGHCGVYGSANTRKVSRPNKKTWHNKKKQIKTNMLLISLKNCSWGPVCRPFGAHGSANARKS
jgi:hypothetical protein